MQPYSNLITTLCKLERQFIGFGDLHGPKPYKFIGFGDLHGPKPYKFIGFGDPALLDPFRVRALRVRPGPGARPGRAVSGYGSASKGGLIGPPTKIPINL